jgi:hypothetical protein
MYPHVYVQALDRLAFAIGRKAVLPAAFQRIPLASHNCELWHAGLVAITSVAEGAGKVLSNHERNTFFLTGFSRSCSFD